ncbi:hypothetical protein [Deinococcus budaensis]|uniref:Uncharacterized protein n=1 Tax=Deinococcus budaensis TaxID=1665626 RepID=A0A7W8GHZ1_9DEIO|nr:hypothetical protein [Deinococcus budaensis]MBB5235975.1 hypothetical protein [Deinococcus budaensis]
MAGIDLRPMQLVWVGAGLTVLGGGLAFTSWVDDASGLYRSVMAQGQMSGLDYWNECYLRASCLGAYFQAWREALVLKAAYLTCVVVGLTFALFGWSWRPERAYRRRARVQAERMETVLNRAWKRPRGTLDPVKVES